MKFVALVSGGKDSFYSIMECIRNGHELLACAHLAPRKVLYENGEEDEESYMYQTAASEAIPTLVEECLGVPLMMRQCVGRSQKTSLVYDADYDYTQGASREKQSQDEVEDLLELLIDVKKKFPEVEGISSGAILSTYQRTRIESVCARLNLTPLGYLWRSGTQKELLECMLKDGIDAVLVKVASPPGLIPHKHLNKSLATLYYGGVFDRLKEKFDFHVCGEGGEYETLVLDCPLFKKRLSLIEVKIIETDDGVGILRVLKCCALEKETQTDWDAEGEVLIQRIRPLEDDEDEIEIESNPVTSEEHISSTTEKPKICHLPYVKVLSGGLAHVSEIMCQNVPKIDNLDLSTDDPEAELAVLEAKCIFNTLALTLSTLDWTGNGRHKDCNDDSATAKDVVFVHLYLSSISHFTKINKHYQHFFGIVLPPSRSCVAIGENVLPGGRRVMLDCIIQRGSGTYMRIQPEETLDSLTTSLSKKNAIFIQEQRMNPHHTLRSTLHVQTISHWAPVCVGPYSQANTLRSSLIFLAGQIGLFPSTMKLIDGGWSKELVQCWKNAACVLDALEGSLNDIIGGVVYISSVVYHSQKEKIWERINQICNDAMSNNGGVLAGQIDERKSSHESEEFGGYEDYETWKAMTGSEEIESDPSDSSNGSYAPLLIVALPEMPKGASAEVELICASNKATSCLDMEDALSWMTETNIEENSGDQYHQTIYQGQICWDIGCNGQFIEEQCDNNVLQEYKIESASRSIGKGCVAVAYSIAYFNEDCGGEDRWMTFNLTHLLREMIVSAMDTMTAKSELDKIYTLHVRLFYNISSMHSFGCDAYIVRCALASAIAVEWSGSSEPAISVVPVDAMCMLSKPQSSSNTTSISPCLGMKITAADLVHTETEMWIHYNRQYNN